MGIATRQRPVATAVAALLVVAAVLVLDDLALATVQGIEPNKAGQPGRVLLRERQDGPWMLIGGVITETAVSWDGGVTGVRYGTDSPGGGVDNTPNASLLADRSLTLRLSL